MEIISHFSLKFTFNADFQTFTFKAHLFARQIHLTYLSDATFMGVIVIEVIGCHGSFLLQEKKSFVKVKSFFGEGLHFGVATKPLLSYRKQTKERKIDPGIWRLTGRIENEK